MIQQLLQHWVSQFRRRQSLFQLDGHFGPYGEAQVLCYFHDAMPSCIGIRAVRLSTHEGNGAVTQVVKMTQRKLRGAMMIEHYVGNSTYTAVPGYGHNGQRELGDQVGVNGDQPL